MTKKGNGNMEFFYFYFCLQQFLAFCILCEFLQNKIFDCFEISMKFCISWYPKRYIFFMFFYLFVETLNQCKYVGRIWPNMHGPKNENAVYKRVLYHYLAAIFAMQFFIFSKSSGSLQPTIGILRPDMYCTVNTYV